MKSNMLTQSVSTITIECAINKQKPDLVIIYNYNKNITLLELSIPFETNIDSTLAFKVNQYRPLISDIEDNHFFVDYYTIEIRNQD